jgi:hypothetical protein
LIFYSGYDSQEMRAWAVPLVQKPAHPEHIVDTLAQVLMAPSAGAGPHE